VCSGEELPVSLARKCLESLPHARLSNLYGPTEAAVDVTFWECNLGHGHPRVPIGRPISNIRMYVLDRHGQPVPIGVAGDIFIGGVGVGRGYLNRPELTAERFIADPFSPAPSARLYKTGDLGRWSTDGALEYLGRNDHQVKIRGFRIELGEIESQLIAHPGVKEAVVLAREDMPGEKRLVGYVVLTGTSTREGTVSVESLRTHLKSSLPEYMVPSAFVIVECFPLSSNGKLDRRALPAPEREAYSSRNFEPPQGELEEALAAIWRELLQAECVGRRDNFFELGGHSIHAIRLISTVAGRLGVDLAVPDVFRMPTIEQMTVGIESQRRSKVTADNHESMEVVTGVV